MVVVRSPLNKDRQRDSFEAEVGTVYTHGEGRRRRSLSSTRHDCSRQALARNTHAALRALFPPAKNSTPAPPPPPPRTSGLRSAGTLNEATRDVQNQEINYTAPCARLHTRVSSTHLHTPSRMSVCTSECALPSLTPLDRSSYGARCSRSLLRIT